MTSLRSRQAQSSGNDEFLQKHKKSICFITGVPGAGKTLAGLNIANERHKFSEYTRGLTMSELLNGLRYTVVEKLHPAVSLRSFRNENVAIFEKSILDVDKWNARSLYDSINIDYPIYLTRDIDKAKLWIKSQANGTERYGIVASSGAKRLRSSGIWVQNG